MKLFISIFGVLAILLSVTIVVTEITMMSIADLYPVIQSKIIDRLVLYHLLGTNLIALVFASIIIFGKEE